MAFICEYVAQHKRFCSRLRTLCMQVSSGGGVGPGFGFVPGYGTASVGRGRISSIF